MPKLASVAPTFPVADVDAAIRWYETELGFTSYPFPNNPPYVFASVCRDQVEIMFQRIEAIKSRTSINCAAAVSGTLTFAWKASKIFTNQ